MKNLTEEEAQQFLKEFEHAQELIKKWGWHVAMRDLPDDAPVEGMIVGSTEYLDQVLLDLDPGDHWRTDHDDEPNFVH